MKIESVDFSIAKLTPKNDRIRVGLIMDEVGVSTAHYDRSNYNVYYPNECNYYPEISDLLKNYNLSIVNTSNVKYIGGVGVDSDASFYPYYKVDGVDVRHSHASAYEINIKGIKSLTIIRNNIVYNLHRSDSTTSYYSDISITYTDDDDFLVKLYSIGIRNLVKVKDSTRYLVILYTGADITITTEKEVIERLDVKNMIAKDPSMQFYSRYGNNNNVKVKIYHMLGNYIVNISSYNSNGAILVNESYKVKDESELQDYINSKSQIVTCVIDKIIEGTFYLDTFYESIEEYELGSDLTYFDECSYIINLTDKFTDELVYWCSKNKRLIFSNSELEANTLTIDKFTISNSYLKYPSTFLPLLLLKSKNYLGYLEGWYISDQKVNVNNSVDYTYNKISLNDVSCKINFKLYDLYSSLIIPIVAANCQSDNLDNLRTIFENYFFIIPEVTQDPDNKEVYYIDVPSSKYMSRYSMSINLGGN